MNDERQMTIHFNNGAQLKVAFPKQIKNSPAAVLESVKRAMESDKLAIEAEGRLIVIPWSSVKQLEVDPVPSALPFGAIKGAHLTE